MRLQLGGSASEALIQTTRITVKPGAILIDVNFGGPAKGELKECAGASMVNDLRGLEEVVTDILKCASDF